MFADRRAHLTYTEGQNSMSFYGTQSSSKKNNTRNNPVMIGFEWFLDLCLGGGSSSGFNGILQSTSAPASVVLC